MGQRAHDTDRRQLDTEVWRSRPRSGVDKDPGVITQVALEPERKDPVTKGPKMTLGTTNILEGKRKSPASPRSSQGGHGQAMEHLQDIACCPETHWDNMKIVS